MAKEETFKGYGPEQGYSFLVSKIIEYDYMPGESGLMRTRFL